MSGVDLLALAALVEASAGADRELDALIHEAFERPFVMEYWSEADTVPQRNLSHVPNYTASLDAAMTLVPEGYDWAVFRTNGGLTIHAWCGNREDVFAATPALALTAACLRARHQSAAGEGESDV